jgi:hypothetical protein
LVWDFQLAQLACVWEERFQSKQACAGLPAISTGRQFYVVHRMFGGNLNPARSSGI